MNFYDFSNIYSNSNKCHVQVYQANGGSHRVHGGRHVLSFHQFIYFRIWTITDRVLRTENLDLRSTIRDVHTVARIKVLIHSDTNEFFKEKQNLENDIKEV